MSLEFDPLPPHHTRSWLAQDEQVLQELRGFGYLCDVLMQVFFELWCRLEQLPPENLNFEAIAMRFHEWLTARSRARDLYDRFVDVASIRDVNVSASYARHRDWLLRRVRTDFVSFTRGVEFYGAGPVPADTAEAVDSYLAAHPWFSKDTLVVRRTDLMPESKCGIDCGLAVAPTHAQRKHSKGRVAHDRAQNER